MIRKRILVAPLDWGLGHATRCIPVIKKLLENNVEVIIGADGRPLDLLKNEFPQLEHVRMPGYNIKYPHSGSMALKLFFQLPKIFYKIKEEHELLKKIIQEKKIDAVISDNRYGLWNKNIPCVFITHQLWIKAPIVENSLHTIIRYYISKYAECWIPDIEGKENLSGELSHKTKLPSNYFFIGPLSRFKKPDLASEKKYDLLVLISGPEPQRSIFETIMLKELIPSELNCLVVKGMPEKKEETNIRKGLTIVPHLDSVKTQEAILASELIISRPGYSTIMDLATLGKKAVFVPTPGQTEQEYLGKKLQNEKIAFCISQNSFSLNTCLKEIKKYEGFKKDILYSNNELQNRIAILVHNSLFSHKK